MQAHLNGSADSAVDDLQTEILVQRINSLDPPYRRNFVDWLESFSNERMNDLESGIREFLENQSPHMRGMYLNSLMTLAEEACRYFGMANVPEA